MTSTDPKAKWHQMVDIGPKGLDLANLGGTKPNQEVVEAVVRVAQEAMRKSRKTH